MKRASVEGPQPPWRRRREGREGRGGGEGEGGRKWKGV